LLWCHSNRQAGPRDRRRNGRARGRRGGRRSLRTGRCSGARRSARNGFAERAPHVQPRSANTFSPRLRQLSIFHLIITNRTDLEKLRTVVPEPLEINQREPLVKYEFIRMPDSTGFGDYTESGQVIPVSFRGRRGDYTHCMFLNDEGPIAGGRELWGFPKKLRQDYVEEAWRIVDPVLMETTPVYEYEAGSWGPHEMDKNATPPCGWHNPTVA
jgi:Acetoacetate decarboxylase (ADC)/Glucose-6-phosphate dehydrogenase, C-terminal domain